MTPALAYGAATAAFAGAAVLYFRGRLLPAGLLAPAFALLVAWAGVHALGPLAAVLVLALLLAGPGIFLLVHVVDARHGLFLLPTLYAIPLAFLTGALAWAIIGLALLL